MEATRRNRDLLAYLIAFSTLLFVRVARAEYTAQLSKQEASTFVSITRVGKIKVGCLQQRSRQLAGGLSGRLFSTEGRRLSSSRTLQARINVEIRRTRALCKKTPRATLPPSAPVDQALPGLKSWEANMVSFGRHHCDHLNDPHLTNDERLSATYYDAQWIYYQIADYTQDAIWYQCAEKAEKVYRDSYAAPAGGRVAGYWNFTHGLTQSFLRTGDVNSKSIAISISLNGAYARDNTSLSETADVSLSREVAYAIHSYLNAELLGQPRRPRLLTLVNQALGHAERWANDNTISMRSFMVGLTAHALISYTETTNDNRILPSLIKTLERLWNVNWVAQRRAFKYETVGDSTPAADLNLLIAPAYAWVYHRTGDKRWADRADEIFKGGIEGAYLANPKQFNQNYRWSFDYVRWRSSASGKSTR